jgi:DNA polymerase-3 subunit epsilon
VTVGAVLFDFEGRNKSQFYSPVRADGRAISSGASAVHGITSKEAARSGMPEVIVLGAVCAMAAEAEYLTGFNVGFDRSILESALIRIGKDTRKLCRPGLQVVDLMLPCAPFCKEASGREDGSYKWPRLDDAISTIRHERPRKGHHNALDDCLRAKRLFLSLHHRGALDIPRAA